MKLFMLAWFSIFLIFFSISVNVVQASTRFSVSVNFQDFQSPQYVTVTGNVTKTAITSH